MIQVPEHTHKKRSIGYNSNLLLVDDVSQLLAICQSLLEHPYAHFVCQGQLRSSAKSRKICTRTEERKTHTVEAWLRPGVGGHELGGDATPVPTPNHCNSLLPRMPPSVAVAMTVCKRRPC
jgi:hypothetical protein